jgi:hypothetical protein
VGSSEVRGRHSPKHSIIQRNMKLAANWADFMFEKKVKMQEVLEQRSNMAKEINNRNFLLNHKRKVFLLHRWDIIRKNKTEKEREEALIQLKKDFKKKWITEIACTRFILRIFKQYRTARKEILYKIYERFAIKRMLRYFRKNLARKGPDYN